MKKKKILIILAIGFMVIGIGIALWIWGWNLFIHPEYTQMQVLRHWWYLYFIAIISILSGKFLIEKI